MPRGKAVILDGTLAGDRISERVLDRLREALQKGGAQVETIALRDQKLAHCQGCFGCWVETPGLCVQSDAAGEILRALVHSRMTVLFTRVTFGGYSPELKRIVDRIIPVLLPTFEMLGGELHHPARYPHPPRIVGVGIQPRACPEEAHIFKMLVGRNAINLRAPSYAAEVIAGDEDTESLRGRLQQLLVREDELPFGEPVTGLVSPPDPASSAPGPVGARRALLIVGSPKIKRPSTSAVLGGYLLERLAERGWETEALTLRANLCRDSGQAELVAAMERAGLILLAFPLYADSLPFLVTKALAVMAAHWERARGHRPQRLVAICNNGFPEAHQNNVALAICQRFAHQSGMSWAGGLALGAGEALSSGRPLDARGRSSPPVKHVMRALDLSAAALDQGRPAPAEAAAMLAKSPIPLAPFALWRWLFVKVAGRDFVRWATENGLGKDQLFDRPYLPAGG